MRSRNEDEGGVTPTARLLLDEQSGPAQRITSSAATLLLSGALATAARADRVAAPVRRRWFLPAGLRSPMAFAAMIVLLVGGLSAAAYVAGRHLARIHAAPAPSDRPPAPSVTAPHAARIPAAAPVQAQA